MFEQILWKIDRELDGKRFERLSIDLLYRNGYRDIVPIEPQDAGRDAEEFPRRGRDRDGFPAFFQFSLEEDWKSKLRETARKLANRRFKFSTLVLVTSRAARGVDVDALKTEIRRKYRWTLIVYSREWLRLQLEEPHTDLAKRHLDVVVPFSLSQTFWIIPDGESDDGRLSHILGLLSTGEFESAGGAAIAFLKDNPESTVARQALAWSHYSVHRFDSALREINRALKLENGSQALSIKASILTEKGIQEGNKAAVREGLRLFEQLLRSTTLPLWQAPYNVGNALSALGRHEDAITRYKEALAIDTSKPEIWKNLASAYHQVGNHEEEMKCFDRALELDPVKPETLVSKAISLISDFGKAAEAVPLLETATMMSPKWRAGGLLFGTGSPLRTNKADLRPRLYAGSKTALIIGPATGHYWP
jgi:tetratricopeptide (TPR) repeat protein